MSPFWEDDLQEVLSIMGPTRVLFGSDWPHMEGLPAPGDILKEVGDLSPKVLDLFLHQNTRGLTERRRAS
jgi:predicted TIM-barrel fold metal-dependent hydrolase